MISKATWLLIAAAVTAAVNDLAGITEPTNAPETPSGDAAPKPRGRPPGSKAAPKEEPPANEGKKFTRDELMAVVEPLMKAKPNSRKPEVAALIKQHGGTCLSDIPAENQQAFVDDAEALQL